MKRTFHKIVSVALVAVPAVLSFANSKSVNSSLPPEITLMRTPDNGIQPQTVVDSRGVLHMIYFKGDPSSGDIEYVYRAPGAKTLSTPIRVNSQPGSAMAIGTVRGPQMAVGRAGRVYVVWLGSAQARPRSQDGSAPVLFSRLHDSGTAFEPQRVAMQSTTEVDGGLSVAADRDGNAYVVCHARGDIPGEAHRRVFLARSTDDGQTFAREVPVSPPSLGACGCCGMRAFADARGTVYILYRAAAQNIHRDMTLLVSADHGQTFRASAVASWNFNACPMTTNYLAEDGELVLAAWDTEGRVYFGGFDARSFQLSAAVAAPGKGDNQNHPAIAANSRGQVLLAWAEDTGWSKGGSLAWQMFDDKGRATGLEGHAPGVPAWGLPAAFADSDGRFMIVY